MSGKIVGLLTPGVVQQEVDFSELGDHVSDRGLGLLLAGHIQRDMSCAATGGADLLGNRGDALFIDVGNAHLGPKRSPVLGDCGAHSLCAPCDQGFFCLLDDQTTYRRFLSALRLEARADNKWTRTLRHRSV